jgi:hypothetical protein
MAQTETPRSELAAALVAAQQELKHAILDKNNPHFKSKYASLASVIDASVHVLAKHGITVKQRRVQKDDGAWVLRTWLEHTSGERDDVPDEQSLDEGTVQQRGSSLTYARRYGLSTVACIASEEDDDGNAASESTPAKSARQARKEGFYPIAEKAIREQLSLESLKEWWAFYQDEIKALPHSWIALLEEEKDRRKLQLIDEMAEDTELKKQLKGSLV